MRTIQLRGGALATVALLAIAVLATAQETEAPSAAALEAHVRFLADDLLAGREPGTDGFDIAAAYVESHFRQYGLEPAGDRGTYLQWVPLSIARASPEVARMTVHTADGDVRPDHSEEFRLDPEPGKPSSSVRAPVVVVGHGIDAPELGVDDYAGVDVTGAIVMTFVGAPDRLPTDARAHLSREETKAKTAASHGAVGMLRVYPAIAGQDDPFARGGGGGRGSMVWGAGGGVGHDPAPGIEVSAAISQRTATMLLIGNGRSLAEVSRAAAAGLADSFELDVEVSLAQSTSLTDDFESPNVVARLPGSDPDLADEHIVITAHLDHVGVGRPDATGDTIYNGAGDNASGTAVLLEAARVLAADPPRRSVLFVAATAEERGLVGTDYFVHNPPVPIESIVANVNLDSGVFLYDFLDIIPFGTQYSTLDDNVRRVAARLDLAIGEDPLPEEALFTRSDHYRFVQQGIPSMFFMCGMTSRDPDIDGLTALRGYVANHLHRPSDQIDLPWNWDGAARYATMVAETVRDIADAGERPVWREGNVFARLDRR